MMRYIACLFLILALCLPASAIVLTVNTSDHIGVAVPNCTVIVTPSAIQTNGASIITLSPFRGPTDANGIISWTNVVPNTFTVDINSPFRHTVFQITITNGTPTNASLNAKDLITVATNNGFNAAYPMASSDARYVQVSSNFLDVANKPTALANIGGLSTNLAPGRIFVGQANGGASGVVMTQDATMNTNGNLVLANTGQARADLGLGSASTNNTTDFQSGNLTLTNLAAGTATALLGTSGTKAAAGNDSRITGAAQTVNNLSDLANASTARANLGLGAMAQQPTNAPRFYAATNYGPFTIPESAPGSNDEMLNFGATAPAQLWYNLNHSVEPELQFGIQGSISFTIGQDGQGKAVGHVGGSGAYHSIWYMQYDDAGLTNAPGHSTPWGYALHLNQGTSQNFIFGYWNVEQDPGMAQTYRLNWHDYGGRPAGGFNQTEFMPSDHIAGGLGSNTFFWGGAELTNTITRGNANINPTATNVIDFSYASLDYVTLTPSSALTLVATNLSYTNKTISKTIFVHGSFLDIPLTLPTNWITVTNVAQSANVIPTNAPASNDLVIQITANCGATTNIYASYSLAFNPPTTDSNAAAFFTASGISDATIKSAINTFCVTAKANNFWNNLRAFHPHVGGTSNTCSWNLVNTNLYRITWNGGMSFASTGITGNGTDAYGDLNLVPSTALTNVNTSSMFVWVRGAALPTDSGYFYGTIGNSPFARWGAFRNGSFFQVGGMNANTTSDLTASAGGTFIGFLGQNRTGSTTEQDYLSGAAVGSTTGKTATVGLPTVQNVYILARNGPPADHFSNANLTGDCVAENMTAQNVTDLQAAWAAMNTALGR